MKLGIIVDSSSGLTFKEAQKKGWEYVPLTIIINNKEYRDGIDIDSKKYYEFIDINMEVSTATTTLGEVEKILEETTKKYDYVIVYLLSKELSSQVNNFINVSKKYNNIFVVPSNGVGHSIVSDCNILEKMSKSNYSWNEIKNHALKLTKAQFGLAAPKTMKWLVKGGRISGATASMARLFHIVPIIQLKDGKLEKFGKGRVFEKTIEKMARFLANKYKNHEEEYIFSLYHGNNKNLDSILEEIKPYIKIDNISLFPPIITNHIGPGVIAIIAHLKN